jgi:Xaa-Pro aminopeptidase
MSTTRREMLSNASYALLGAGFLKRFDRVAGSAASGIDAGNAASPSLTSLVRQQEHGASAAMLLKPKAGEEGPPPPATADRLPVEWNKATVQRFKDILAERDIATFVVREPLNIIYLTGYWHTTTERPQSIAMNRDDTAPWYFYPALDRDLVRTWWFGGGTMYFDIQHAEGAFPNEGTVQQGETVDLFRMMLTSLKKKGIQGKRIAIDGELYPSELAKINDVLPDTEWVNVKDVLLKMREVKTAEELALWSRAYTYFDRAHCFARDYILTHGTDVTDFEVATATNLWINDRLWSDIDLHGGVAHYGVGTGVEIECRAGTVTAYPHPNQPYYNRIGRNMALQVSGVARIGGYGHENYRAYILADAAGKFDPHMQKLWTVSRDCCDMQLAESIEGVTCSSVAYKILKHQVAEGVQDYIYHRPAHGAGSEGHQPPYLALGDYTMLRRNMCFSEEPGLYDAKTGCGFNWSDTIVVGVKSGYRMSRVPYSTEWCWLKV